MGFPCGSAGKNSACDAGDPGLIPGSGRSPGEGVGCPLQYCWVSLVAQMVKNPHATRETWVRSLGWEDPLEEGTATRSSSRLVCDVPSQSLVVQLLSRVRLSATPGLQHARLLCVPLYPRVCSGSCPLHIAATGGLHLLTARL